MTATRNGRRRGSGRPPAKRSYTLEPFTFVRNGKTYTLMSFAALPFGLVRRIRHLPEHEAIFQIFEEVAEPEVLAIVDAMNSVQVGELVRDWQEHAQVTLGELQRSSVLPMSTPPHSPTTGAQDSGSASES